MNITERDRLAASLVGLRPDWAGTGIDKLKSIRTWLTENAMDWSFRDAVVRMSVCAIEPSTVTYARALLDGPWLTIARTLSSDGISQPLTGAELGGDCGICGVREAMHRGARVLSDDIGPHDWVPSPAHIPADAETIARLKPTFHRTEQHA